ncbi:MAG TPA: hypothetical protein PLH39_02490 [Promineifilum sp.]|nr:hypothetical protein [Promineifilum sp.]
MAVPPFNPRPQSQHVELLSRILDRVQADLPGALGSAITVHDVRRDDPVTVLAARGAGEALARAQLAGSGGPVGAAVEHQIPVVTLDLWSDERWPDLTPAAASRSAPARDTEWARVRGAAAVSGTAERRSDGFVALRKGLGYCWSVAVVAAPARGQALMEKWLADEDKDVRWIMRENLGKARLARLDADWLARQRARLEG